MSVGLIALGAACALLAGTVAFRALMRLGEVEVPSWVEARPRRRAQGAEALGRLLGRIAPLEAPAAEELTRSLTLSGVSWTPAQLWCAQLAGSLAGAGAAATLARGSGVASPLTMGAGALVGFALPRLVVVLRRRRWHGELSHDLPDMLDLLCVSVNSGTTLERGLSIVADAMDGPLAEACGQVVRHANQEPVAKAFERFAISTGLDDLIAVGHAVSHATDTGAPVSKVLLEQAKRLRAMRKLQVDEASAKLDNQITVVCGLLVMPAAFAAALLPYVWSIIQEFGTFS